MRTYPKMIYRGEPCESWEAIGKAIHAREIETRIVEDAAEEAAHIKEGFGPVAGLLVEPTEKKPRKGKSAAS